MSLLSNFARNCSLVLLLFATASGVTASEAFWPQFRGPDGQGNVPTSDAPLEWSETKGVRWKTAIPGRGWSSPVVLGDQIWMTTAIETAPTPEQREERLANERDAASREVAAELSLRAICVDRHSGRVIHDIEVFNVQEPEAIHSLNSYASPTPVIEPGRLYCHFGRYGTACLDTTDGKKIWECAFPIEHYVGPGSSPVVCGDLLVLTCDGADKQFIAAVDKRNGQTAWKVDRPPIRKTDPDLRKSYCTPLVIEHNGQQQIVIPGAQWVVAYHPHDGRELWRVDHGDGFSLVSRPVVNGDHVYCATGFNGVGMVAVRLGGEGDVSKSHIVWKYRQQAPNQPSPVLHNGRLYTVSDNGIGQCLDAENGEVVWKQRLLGDYSASPLRIGDRIYYFNRDGLTTVLSADDEGKEIVQNQLDGSMMATPAVVDGELIVRTDKHVYAIEQ